MKKKKPKIRTDNKGQYILQQYFVGGKMKHERIYVIDSIPVDVYYNQNADSIVLLQNGDYEVLHEDGF